MAVRLLVPESGLRFDDSARQHPFLPSDLVNRCIHSAVPGHLRRAVLPVEKQDPDAFLSFPRPWQDYQEQPPVFPLMECQSRAFQDCCSEVPTTCPRESYQTALLCFAVLQAVPRDSKHRVHRTQRPLATMNFANAETSAAQGCRRCLRP